MTVNSQPIKTGCNVEDRNWHKVGFRWFFNNFCIRVPWKKVASALKDFNSFKLFNHNELSNVSE